MNLQGLGKVEPPEWYVNLAFKRARKVAEGVKSQQRRTPHTIKDAELAKIREIRRTLRKHTDIILKAFPSIDGLDEFYQELIRTMLDYAELKKSLGGVRWAQQKVEFFSDNYQNKIKRCHDFTRLLQYSKEFYGRISSVMKQVKKQLAYLEESRKILESFPHIKTKLYTVCIAGFPNVGKTTLLSSITSSSPKIANYAFTTKQLNIGYATIKNHKVQFIDTPGTLDRFNKMNEIEQQAYLAMKYCADLIVFVFDTSNQTYTADDQKKLLRSLNKFRKDIIIYASKTDLKDHDITPLARMEYHTDIAPLKSVVSTMITES